MKIKIETLLLTIATVIFVLYWVYLILLPPGFFGVNSNVAIISKDLNYGEFGSLLSGLFAPLAFIWLFYGYFQQSKSLSILIEERQNKRKVLRPKFELFKQKRTAFSSDYKTQYYLLTFKIQGVAYRIKCNPTINDDGFRFDKDSYDIDSGKKSSALPSDIDLKDGEEFTLHLTVDLNKNTKSKVINIDLNCLDIDGYDCYYKIYLKCEIKPQLFYPDILDCTFVSDIENLN